MKNIDKETVHRIVAYLRTEVKTPCSKYCSLCNNSTYSHHEIECPDGDGYPSTKCVFVANAIENKFLDKEEE